MKGTSVGAVALMGGGFLFLWSGYHGAALTGSLRDLLQGKQPSGSDTSPTGGAAVSPIGTGGAVQSSANAYNHAGLESLWTGNGGSPSTANIAAAIAQAESSGRPAVTSANPDGGINVGLWQLDTRGKGAGYTVAQLQDPDTNARVAIMGSANGTDWSAWATYASGAYRGFLA